MTFGGRDVEPRPVPILSVVAYLAGVAGLAFCLTLLPGQALASRPSTPADIKSILEAVQTSPLLNRIPGRPFIVTKITISTASADPVYASGVVTPRAVKNRRAQPILLLFRQNPNLSWTLIDFGRTLGSEVHLEKMLDRIVYRLGTALLVNRAAVFLEDPADVLTDEQAEELSLVLGHVAVAEAAVQQRSVGDRVVAGQDVVGCLG